jgi:hypothetical protein
MYELSWQSQPEITHRSKILHFLGKYPSDLRVMSYRDYQTIYREHSWGARRKGEE